MAQKRRVFEASIFNVQKVMHDSDFEDNKVTKEGWKRLTSLARVAHDAMLQKMIRFHRSGYPLLVAIETRDFVGRPCLGEPVVYGCYETHEDEGNLIIKTGEDRMAGRGLSWVQICRIQPVHPLHLAEGLNKALKPWQSSRSILD